MRRDVFYALMICFITTCVSSFLLILHHTGVVRLTLPSTVVYRVGITGVVTFIFLLLTAFRDNDDTDVPKE